MGRGSRGRLKPARPWAISTTPGALSAAPAVSMPRPTCLLLPVMMLSVSEHFVCGSKTSRMVCCLMSCYHTSYTEKGLYHIY